MTAAVDLKTEHSNFSATVGARELLAAIGLVLGTARPSTMDVLTRIFIKQGEHGLALASTDLRNATRVTVVRTSMSGVGSAHVHPAGLLSFVQIAARDADAEVHLSFERGTLTVESGPRKLRSIAGYGEDYPTLPAPLKGEPLKIERRALLTLLTDANRFACKDDTRPHLNCVLLRRVDGALHAVATDGTRLVKLTHGMPGAEPSFEAMIPQKSVALWLRALKASRADDVELRKGGGHVELCAGSSSVSTRLVDAAFPPYEHVIPTSWDHEISLSREVLIDATRMAIALQSGDARPWVKLESRGGGSLAITSRSADDAELEATTSHDGPAFRISVNAKILLDSLALARDPRVSLRISGELDPMTIVNERASAVVMPMRV